MSWLLPWALGAAVAATVGVTLLHLLARDRPPPWLLPTARFVAPGTARATRRAPTPRDRLLLAVRALALVLAGAAFAAPVLHPEGGNVAQVVVLDLGDHVSMAAAVDTAALRLRDGDRLVIVDHLLHVATPGSERNVLDSLRAAAGDSATSMRFRPDHAGDAARPSLTAVLIAAVRAAAHLPQQADSAALLLIAPTAAPDAALADARAMWPGRISVVGIAGAATPDSTVGPAVRPQPVVRGRADDPIVAGARLAGARLVDAVLPPSLPGSLTALVRVAPTAADSAWAAAGGTLVTWPSDTAGLVSVATPDTIGGVVADGNAALFTAARAHAPRPGRVVARWIDGAPAVTEQSHGDGCIRTVAIAVPIAGDVTLRPSFQAALQSLMQPCARQVANPISGATQALLSGNGALARAGELRASSLRSPATPWLLAAALMLLLLVEPVLRRRAPASAEEPA